MKTKQAIKTLERYNKWRRGAEIEQPEPKEIGEAIDVVLKALKQPEIIKSVCRTFFPDSSLTTATKCKFCGKEKWEH